LKKWWFVHRIGNSTNNQLTAIVEATMYQCYTVRLGVNEIHGVIRERIRINGADGWSGIEIKRQKIPLIGPEGLSAELGRYIRK